VGDTAAMPKKFFFAPYYLFNKHRRCVQMGARWLRLRGAVKRVATQSWGAVQQTMMSIS